MGLRETIVFKRRQVVPGSKRDNPGYYYKGRAQRWWGAEAAARPTEDKLERMTGLNDWWSLFHV